MKLSKSNFILGLLTVFIIFLFVKSADIGIKIFTEIKHPPAKITIAPCPKKNAAYFKKIPDSDYMKYLYNYLSLEIKC
jgi:hypothetical protein